MKKFTVFISSCDEWLGYVFARELLAQYYPDTLDYVYLGAQNGRSDYIADLERRGGRVVTYDTHTLPHLNHIFGKCDSVVLVPVLTNLHFQIDIWRYFFVAIEAARVRRIFMMSVLDLDRFETFGPFQNVYRMEGLFRDWYRTSIGRGYPSDQLLTVGGEEDSLGGAAAGDKGRLRSMKDDNLPVKRYAAIFRHSLPYEHLLLYRTAAQLKHLIVLPIEGALFTPVAYRDVAEVVGHFIRGKLPHHDHGHLGEGSSTIVSLGKESPVWNLTGQEAIGGEGLALTAQLTFDTEFRYVPFTPDETREYLHTHSALAPEEINYFIGFYDGIRQGLQREIYRDLAEFLGRDPIDAPKFLQKHARELKPIKKP
ncbi:hypothetical protein IWQ60_000675 [Tieghemiomyces parasiticus]|uniref:Uncharacterized protein n=1 Tax=Tieghemiomyces parasiticus TaxID=78921 RepID=A0A9W8AL96_9FUNG|nr:hypothetical protein IWQ60_000675 [Tieghemiomyces parasiticus]